MLNGAYTLTGDSEGEADTRIEAGTSVVLDPDRLTAASGEWTIQCPSRSPRARFEIVVGPAPTFTLQRHVPPDKPGGEARWVDVEETLNLQPTARLPPEAGRLVVGDRAVAFPLAPDEHVHIGGQCIQPGVPAVESRPHLGPHLGEPAVHLGEPAVHHGPDPNHPASATPALATKSPARPTPIWAQLIVSPLQAPMVSRGYARPAPLPSPQSAFTSSPSVRSTALTRRCAAVLSRP